MGQNVVRVALHFVWATRDRLPLVEPEMERRLYRYVTQVCEDDKCPVLAIGGMPDHVHLLVNYAATISMSDLMRHVKGGSSRFVSDILCPGQWFQWQASYGVFCVEPNNQTNLIAYIANQKHHHAQSKTWPNVEATSLDFPVPAKAVTRPKAT